MNEQHKNVEKSSHSTTFSDWDFQVVLHNDSHNTFDHVVTCLTRVFGFGKQMAIKVAMEAHTRGKAIAEVEEEKSAVKHCLMLRVSGLGADVERI